MKEKLPHKGYRSLQVGGHRKNGIVKTASLVDEDLFAELNQHKWSLSQHGYVNRKEGNRGNQRLIYMHRFILGAKKGELVDHINCNKLDNRQANLRLCTATENTRNVGLRKNNSSGYKGVSWSKDKQKWVVKICVDKKQLSLGYFDSLGMAIEAYATAAKKYHKKFANYGGVHTDYNSCPTAFIGEPRYRFVQTFSCKCKPHQIL